MSRINLCFFCSLSSFDTGMPISTFKLIKHFGQLKDFSVHVILPSEGELSRRVRACGVEPAIIPFNRLRSWRRMGDFAKFLFSFPRAFLRICIFLRKNRIDCVHFSDIIDMPFYACGRLSRVRSVTHLRHCIESSAARFLFGLFADSFIDKVICISQAALRFSGVSPPLAAVIYNPGPDLSLFDPHRSYSTMAGLPENKPMVLTIGKFLKDKGHEHFIAMARRVESLHPGLASFVILGDKVSAHEDYYALVSSLIERFGLVGKIHILGQTPHETVPAILARASVYVHLPNWQEALGGVILEAMAMRVPIVAFDCGGISECFTDKESGFLVDRLDIDAAADRVASLLINEQKRLKMGASARKELAAKFSYEKHFSEIEQIYNDLDV